MSLNKITRHVLAGALSAIGFSACTTDEPELYGTPLLYGPLPMDSTEIDTTSSILYGVLIKSYDPNITDATE